MKAAKSFLTHRPVAVSMVFLAAVRVRPAVLPGTAGDPDARAVLSDAHGAHRVSGRGAGRGRERRLAADRGAARGGRRLAADEQHQPRRRVRRRARVRLGHADVRRGAGDAGEARSRPPARFGGAAAHPALRPGSRPGPRALTVGRGRALRGRGGPASPAPAGRTPGQAGARADRRRRRGSGPRRPGGGDSRAPRRSGPAALEAVGPAGDRPPGAGEHQRRRRHAQGGGAPSTWCERSTSM